LIINTLQYSLHLRTIYHAFSNLSIILDVGNLA
jgi:hypothetical protein